MPGFTTESLLPVPPAEVFQFICDLSRWPLFRGAGPLPGIVEATVDGGVVGPGSRIRVRNTDGTVHHEVVERFEPGRLYIIRMELVPPASYLMADIEEQVELSAEGGGTRMRRTFKLNPRFWLATPLVALIASAWLRPAVEAHNEAARGALATMGTDDGHVAGQGG